MKHGFEVYKDDKGEWRWRLIATNGQIVATAHEGYVNQKAVFTSIARLVPTATNAPVRVVDQ
jgi:uncharacterized protein YegP (UPF0339 family)